MITSSQFPDLEGKTALPAMSRQRSHVKSPATPFKMNKLTHPLAKPASAPRAPRAPQPPSDADAAIKAMKQSTKLGQLAQFAANTTLRKTR